MPADNLKSTDDLVYWGCWVQIIPREKYGDCTFYHNTMRTSHNPLGTRIARFLVMFLFAKQNCVRSGLTEISELFCTILWVLRKVAGAKSYG